MTPEESRLALDDLRAEKKRAGAARHAAKDTAKAEMKRQKHELKATWRTQKKAIKAEWHGQKQEIRTRRRAVKEQLRQAQVAATVRTTRRGRPIKTEPPRRGLLEEIGNSITHGIGAALAAVALWLMLQKANSTVSRLSAIVYGVCLILLFLMSCLYHAFPGGSRVKKLWWRFDYSSIYLLIGGSFTPILLLYIGGTLGTVLCIAMWALIITGVTFIGVFGPGVLRVLHFVLYFTIGWSAVLFLPQMFTDCRPLFYALVGGGLAYTLGAIPFAKDTRGAHFLWHIFVLLGAALHWWGIWQYVF